MLLPLVLVLMLILINRPRIMGRYTNNVAFNVIAWATVIVVGGLDGALHRADRARRRRLTAQSPAAPFGEPFPLCGA